MGASLGTVQWDLSALPKFEKNFYREHPDVQQASDAEITEFRKNASITCIGRDVPKPIRTFPEASFPGKV